MFTGHFCHRDRELTQKCREIYPCLLLCVTSSINQISHPLGLHQVGETLKFMRHYRQIKVVWTLLKTLLYYFSQEMNFLSDQHSFFTVSTSLKGVQNSINKALNAFCLEELCNSPVELPPNNGQAEGIQIEKQLLLLL